MHLLGSREVMSTKIQLEAEFPFFFETSPDQSMLETLLSLLGGDRETSERHFVLCLGSVWKLLFL